MDSALSHARSARETRPAGVAVPAAAVEQDWTPAGRCGGLGVDDLGDVVAFYWNERVAPSGMAEPYADHNVFRAEAPA